MKANTLHCITFLAFLAFPAFVQAQRIHAFVSSGITASQIEGDELQGFKHFGYTGGVGALVSISNNNRWGLSVETLYSQRGSYNNSGNPYSIKLTLHYIDIPVMVHIQDPYGGMLFGLGLDYGRLVQQPHNVMKYNPAYFIPDTTDFSFLSNDLSVVADARFTIWSGLQLDFRWQYSLVAVKRDWHFYEYKNNGNEIKEYINNCYNHSISLRLIYQF